MMIAVSAWYLRPIFFTLRVDQRKWIQVEQYRDGNKQETEVQVELVLNNVHLKSSGDDRFCAWKLEKKHSQYRKWASVIFGCTINSMRRAVR